MSEYENNIFAERDAKITELENLLVEKDKEIEFQRRRFDNQKKDTINNLNTRLAEKDAEIEKLHGNLNTATIRGTTAEMNLKTATNALKAVLPWLTTLDCANPQLIIEKALADIEGDQK